MNNQKKFFKWWWGWHPEKIENWLENLENQGWRPVKSSAALTLFSCVPAEPRKMRYCVDFRPSLTPDYMNLLQEDDWEFLGIGGGWIIWRKPWTLERPEIYTDPDALIERNKKLERLVLLILVIELFLFYSIFSNHGFLDSSLTIKIIFLGVISFLGYIIWQLRRSINALKQKKSGGVI